MCEYGQQYVQVAESEESDVMEVPTEEDGKLLLSTIAGHFPGATGLKYRSPAGAWRAVRCADGFLDPPGEGWQGEIRYVVSITKTDTSKRKSEDSSSQESAKKAKSASDDSFSRRDKDDVIVLGLSFSATRDDIVSYFETYGKLSNVEIKMNPITRQPKGFAFLKFEDKSVVDSVLGNHTICGKDCQVQVNIKKTVPCKLFVGRLPPDTTKEDVTETFESYGELSDVFVPNPFRGFGFVTFSDADDAKQCIARGVTYKSKILNVKYAEPKGIDREQERFGQHNRYESRGMPPPQNESSGLPDMVKLLSAAQEMLMNAKGSQSRQREGPPERRDERYTSNYFSPARHDSQEGRR